MEGIFDKPFLIALLALLAIGSWVYTTRLRIQHGYPLETSWGKAVGPAVTTETAERLKLVAGESAQLRAEVAQLKDRVQVLERIVTDKGMRLDREIEALRGASLN